MAGMASWKAAAALTVALALGLAASAFADCPDFFLKTQDGQIINPATGENIDSPYSPRQTCGSCHNYDAIIQGYHFQQGWNEILGKDKINKEKPWVFSPGMMGKW